MPRYEYKVVPAPAKGLKGKGVKGPEARFSYALQELMNGLAGYGWEYQRAETLPSIERAGLTGSTTEWRNVLVFRRLRENDADAFAPELLPPPGTPVAEPEKTEPTPEPEVAKISEEKPQATAPEPPKTDHEKAVEEANAAWDNGVENTDDVNDVSDSLEKLSEARNPSKSDA